MNLGIKVCWDSTKVFEGMNFSFGDLRRKQPQDLLLHGVMNHDSTFKFRIGRKESCPVVAGCGLSELSPRACARCSPERFVKGLKTVVNALPIGQVTRFRSSNPE